MKGMITVRLGDVHADIRTALKAAPGSGAKGIEVNVLDGPFLTREFGESATRDFTHTVARNGMVISSLRYDAGDRRLTDPGSIDSRVELAMESIRFSARIGARVLIVHTGHPGSDIVAEDISDHFFHTVLKDLSDEATRNGVILCVESTGWLVDERIKYLENHNHIAVAMEFDPALQLARSESPLASLTTLADRCAAIVLRDGYRGGGDVRFAEGDVPWTELALMIETSNFPGPLIVVPFYEPGVSKSECLRQSVQRVVEFTGIPDSDDPLFGDGKIWVPN